jgi:hypothetical protein
MQIPVTTKWFFPRYRKAKLPTGPHFWSPAAAASVPHPRRSDSPRFQLRFPPLLELSLSLSLSLFLLPRVGSHGLPVAVGVGTRAAEAWMAVVGIGRGGAVDLLEGRQVDLHGA